MSNRFPTRRCGVFVVGLTLILAVGVAQAGGKQRATLQCTRDGVSVDEIAAGTQITIGGSGYKRNAQLAVCVDGEGCTYPTADRDGNFSQGRTLYQTGLRTITVSEVASRWSAYRERATGTITVTE